ncbi:4-hydroxy-tetrahydrodipicolinate reductase [Haloglomus salinum]|jgi:4-hydroxy-tetrahydrodipicolinate reductase|uniref:4-hydroxy-tetrahydrodipicolinate reductase n=1 Tax=Haloglomus salinum TaxID=2962673 RepID=UPI0020C98794|nr:4-hydroxy-tetrahydrodipicolinate reductase [Haloglomus salinum]
MKVVVTGATGRTGGEVAREVAERDHDLVPVSREPAGTVAGADLQPPEDLPALLDGADALVDFTVPVASGEYVAEAADAGVPAVVGTTGFDDEGLATLHEAAESAPVLKASNFARGVHALLSVVREAATALPGYDVELTETHHNGKRDAPSGTANTLLDELDDARGEALDRTYGREGEDPREPGQVGVHVRRAGNVRGEHEVMFADNDEVLSLTHRAESRGVFAAGAVDAAEWLPGHEAGWYEFGDVIGDGGD